MMMSVCGDEESKERRLSVRSTLFIMSLTQEATRKPKSRYYSNKKDKRTIPKPSFSALPLLLRRPGMRRRSTTGCGVRVCVRRVRNACTLHVHVTRDFFLWRETLMSPHYVTSGR